MYPSWLARVGANIIDSVVLAVPTVLLAALIIPTLVERSPTGVQACCADRPLRAAPAVSELPTAAAVAMLALYALMIAFQATYFVVLNAHGSRTLGKMAAGYRVVCADGSDLGYGRSFGRWLAQI